jgi:hypothetical protein
MANKNVLEYRNPNKLAVLSVQGKYISSRKNPLVLMIIFLCVSCLLHMFCITIGVTFTVFKPNGPTVMDR